MADSFVADKPDGFVPDLEAAPKPETAKAGAPSARREMMPRDPLDVLLRPEGVTEHIANILVGGPLIGMGGQGLRALATKLMLPAAVTKAAPLVGRVATSGGIGAVQAADRGDSALWGFFLDATVAGLIGEGGATALARMPKVGLAAHGAPARAFEWATQAPGKALAALRGRFDPATMIHVPALSPRPLPPDEAVRRLVKLTGAEYQQARGEIISEFTRMDQQRWAKGPRPYAGQEFARRTSKERFEPPASARLAEGAHQAITSPAGRSAADALAITPEQGIPLGAIGALVAPQRLGELATRVLVR